MNFIKAQILPYFRIDEWFLFTRKLHIDHHGPLRISEIFFPKREFLRYFTKTYVNIMNATNVEVMFSFLPKHLSPISWNGFFWLLKSPLKTSIKLPCRWPGGFFWDTAFNRSNRGYKTSDSIHHNHNKVKHRFGEKNPLCKGNQTKWFTATHNARLTLNQNL